MLQQTQIKTALPYFENWVKKWPNWESLAKAEEEDVLKAWQGLGYYNRAKRLHQLARSVHYDHKDQLPNDLELLKQCPGIGDYTASAIGSIAFNLPTFPIDGNVRRVLARFYDNHEKSPSKDQDAYFKTEMEPVFQKTKKRRALAQALMELGALICNPQPKCDSCPLQKDCTAYKNSTQADLPQKLKKEKSKPYFIYYCWVKTKKGYLVKQRSEKERFANFWQPVLIEGEDEEKVKEEFYQLLNKSKIVPLKQHNSHMTKYKVSWHGFSFNKELKINHYKTVHEVNQLNFIPKLILP